MNIRYIKKDGYGCLYLKYLLKDYAKCKEKVWWPTQLLNLHNLYI